MLGVAAGLIEREVQLATATTAVRAQNGAVILMEGEAGAGKSALIGAALEQLPVGTALWAGRCEPLAVPAPFAALYEMLRVLPEDVAAGVQSGADVISVYAAVLDAMVRRPAALVLDDLQWADASTAGLVRYVGRRLGGTSSTLVCAYRNDELDADHDAAAAIADLARLGTRIDLSPLTGDGVRQLAASIAPDRVDEAETIHRTTGGNPLFVTEVLRTPGEEVPRTVGDIVVAQLHRLPTAAQEVVETIAACPDGLPLDVATALSTEASSHIDIACDRRVLTVDRGRVVCRHELLRTALDTAVPPLRRRELHRRVLEVSEPRADGPADAARLAFHSAEAGLPEKAITYSMTAATQALTVGTHRDALGHLTRALRFREHMTDAELDDVLDRLPAQLALAGHTEAAADAARERFARFSQGASATPAEQGRALMELAGWLSFADSASPDELMRLAEQALSLDDAPASATAAYAKRLLGMLGYGDGTLGPEAALAMVDEALAIARRSGDPSCIARALNTRAVLLYYMNGSGMTEALRESHALALSDRNDFAAAHALVNLAWCAVWTWEFDVARPAVAEGLAFCDDRQTEFWRGAILGSAAVMALNSGDWDDARARLGFDVDTSGCSGAEVETAFVETSIRIRTGDDHESLIDEILATAVGSYPDDMQHLATELALEAAWMGLLDPAAAAARLETTRALRQYSVDPASRERVEFWAQIAGVADVDDALVDPTLWEARQCPLHAALATAVLPEPPTGEVISALEELGATATLAAVRRDWRNRGIAAGSRTAPAHPSGLSSRQVDVLGLLAVGRSNAQIAAELFISEKTAGHHVSAILARLGVANRHAAAALAIERGWC